MTRPAWPVCGACGGNPDIRPLDDGRTVAICCGGQAEVQLGYVLVGERPVISLRPKKRIRKAQPLARSEVQ